MEHYDNWERDNQPAIDVVWDKLIDLGVSEEALQLVTDINGYSIDTLYDVLYSRTGYRNFSQMEG